LPNKRESFFVAASGGVGMCFSACRRFADFQSAQMLRPMIEIRQQTKCMPPAQKSFKKLKKAKKRLDKALGDIYIRWSKVAKKS
jgi:hypothetical protein